MSPLTGTDPVRRRWLTPSDGVTDRPVLHQLDFGGSGRPVVCLHGVTSCAWIWHHTARRLKSCGHVLACDLRGHGASGWAAADRYRTLDHAADLEAVLESLDGGPVDLVGSSWGALVALAVAARRPQVVRRLVLVDMEPSFDRSETEIPDRPDHFAGVDEAAATWRAANPGAPDDLIAILAAAATRPGPSGKAMLAPAHDPLFLQRWPFRSEDWWAALDDVEAPTLVVHAERTWVRAEVCDRMARRLPTATRIDITGATHVIPVDAPDALGAAVAGFLLSWNSPMITGVQEHYGLVWVAAETPVRDLLEFPEWDAGGFDRARCEVRRTPVPVPQLIHNFLDASHSRRCTSRASGPPRPR